MANGVAAKYTIPSLISASENVFKKHAGEETPGGKAVNLTHDGHRKVADEKMKIAAVLNFRLSSSNYATICLRELMSSSWPSRLSRSSRLYLASRFECRPPPQKA